MTTSGENGMDNGSLAPNASHLASKNHSVVGLWRTVRQCGAYRPSSLLVTPSTIGASSCYGPYLMSWTGRKQCPRTQSPPRTDRNSLVARFVWPLCCGLDSLGWPTVRATSEDSGGSSPEAELPEASARKTESSSKISGFFQSYDTAASSGSGAATGGPLLYQPSPGETGWDRIKAMYSTDVYGNLGPEWTLILQSLWGGGVAGVMVGFIIGGRTAAINFFDRNEGTKFNSEMAARRALQDKMTLSMGKFSLMWGWRTAIFTGTYMFLVTNMSVYRGKTRIWDFVVSGGLTGGMWKFLQGPRACLVAGGVGSVLGLVAGAVSMGLLKASGLSLEELRYWHYQAAVAGRRGEVSDDDLMAKDEPTTKDALAQHHNSLVKARQIESSEVVSSTVERQ